MAATIIPKLLLGTVSSILLALFGFNMIKESISMKSTDSITEFEKCNKDIKQSEGKVNI